MQRSLLVTRTIIRHKISTQVASGCLSKRPMWQFLVLGPPWRHIFTLFLLVVLTELIILNWTANTKFIIIINGLITELRLPKNGPELRIFWHVKFGIFRPPSKAHFQLFLLILLALIIFYKTNKRTKLYYDKSCISRIMWTQMSIVLFLEVILTFCPNYKFWMHNFSSILRHICIDYQNISSSSSVGIALFDSVFSSVLLVSGQYCPFMI